MIEEVKSERTNRVMNSTCIVRMLLAASKRWLSQGELDTRAFRISENKKSWLG